MDMISDILLIAGALGAAFYCLVLSRRLSRFTDLDKGVGGAIAVLSAQVDDMTRTLERAQGAAGASTVTLQALTERAEDVARRLELLVASMHDLPLAGAQDSGPTTPDAEPSDPPLSKDTGPDDDPGDTGAIDLFRSRRSWTKEAAE